MTKDLLISQSEIYEKMTWETPSDELADAVENLTEENKRLKEELLEEKENFALFRDRVAIPALQHAHKQLNERDGDDPTIAWIVDLMHEHDYRLQNAEFFYTEEEARRFVDAISDPKVSLNDGWVVTNCYEITKSKMSKSAYDALKKHLDEE